MTRYSYMVGALPLTVTLDYEESILKKCGEFGWELISTIVKTHKGHQYTFHYFKREISENEKGGETPRFNTDLFAKIN